MYRLFHLTAWGAATLPTRGLREALESISPDCLVPHRLNAVFQSAAKATVRLWQEDCFDIGKGCTLGSGFVYRTHEGGRVQILTNAHVTGEYGHVGVTLGEHQRTGRVIDMNSELDLAIVDAYCFPVPQALELSKTVPDKWDYIGISGYRKGVSGLSPFQAVVVARQDGYLYFTGSVASGHSGSPNLSLDGEVVGIVTGRGAQPVQGAGGALYDAGKGYPTAVVADALESMASR